eukprot:1160406-Pelagomonas_calceolata.AAC.7
MDPLRGAPLLSAKDRAAAVQACWVFCAIWLQAVKQQRISTLLRTERARPAWGVHFGDACKKLNFGLATRTSLLT